MFYDQSPILRGVNLIVPENEVVVLLGRNGVGKTTTLKAVMGLVSNKGGSVLMDGEPFGSAKPEIRARRGIGYVPQGRDIFPNLTVWENLKVSLSVAGKGALIVLLAGHVAPRAHVRCAFACPRQKQAH